VADPVSIIVWRDPEVDPPTGDDARRILLLHHGGSLEFSRAYMVKTYRQPAWLAWSELPSLPADPSERLTTNDVEMAANTCEDEAIEMQSLGSRRGREVWERRARRLRAALPGEETK